MSVSMQPNSQFQKLCDIIDTLLGPNGCPWDRKQTLESLREHLLEETHEVIEAITHKQGADALAEELGDLIGMAIFVGKLAEKDKLCTVHDACQAAVDKLIRRHPHIFLEKKELSPDEVVTQWNELKKLEKGKVIDVYERLPKTLPALQCAQEIIRKFPIDAPEGQRKTEEEIGSELYHIVAQAEASGVNAEFALRKTIEEMRKTRNIV